MRRSLLVLCISGISSGAVASGYALWSYTSGDRNEPTSAVSASVGEVAKAPASRMAALTPTPPALPPGTSALLAIEIARIDAGGPSVLAGRSPPNHRVTVLANGREVASVTATEEGQWSAIVEHGISAGPLELAVESRGKDGSPVRGVPRQLVVPEAPSRALAAAGSAARPAPSQSRSQSDAKIQDLSRAPAKSDAGANKRALAEFEALVDRTRKEMAAQQTARAEAAPAEGSRGTAGSPTTSALSQQGQGLITAAPLSGGPALAAGAATASGAVGESSVARSASQARLAAVTPPGTPIASAATEAASAVLPAPIPVPITFVTNDTALTEDGARAAELLAEYLRLKRPAGITLSGHADARGSDGYNMDLSRRRLEAIETYLRDAGYSGELWLVPRGKREPYLGIDRDRLSRSEIYQADRRVELRLTP